MRQSKSVVVEITPTARVAESVVATGRGRLVLGEYVTIEDHVLLDTGSSPESTITINTRSKIKHGAVLRTYDGEILVGGRTSIGEYCVLAGHGGLRIGNEVIVAGHCYFCAADHIFHGQTAVRFQGETARGIVIADGVWFGAQCVVLDGVQVSSGCVVGAGSVVTRNLRGDMLCMGRPCREIRLRIEENIKSW